jgi:hypothetical protein
MPRILLLAFVLTSVSACSRLPDAPEPQAEAGPPPGNVTVISMAADGTRTKSTIPIVPNQLAGEYRTRGMSSDVLQLNPDMTFKCESHGCLGLYGTCSGTWAIDQNGIEPTTTMADGMFKDRPFVRLKVVSLQGHYLLIREDYMDFFDGRGVSRVFCFHQEPALNAIAAEEERRLDERVKQLLDADKKNAGTTGSR